MLDIDMLRPDKGGDPEKFREIQRRRFKDVTLIDRILEADGAWRQQVNAVDSLNAEYNKASKEIGEKMKAGDKAGAEPLKAAQLLRGQGIEDAKKVQMPLTLQPKPCCNFHVCRCCRSWMRPATAC